MTETPPPARQPSPKPSHSMLERFNPGWAAFFVSLIALGLATWPFLSGGMTPQVRAALMNNPEMLSAALQNMQQLQNQQIVAAARATIAQNLPLLNQDPRDPFLGPEQAPVTVVQFFDYRCPYCKQVADAFLAIAAANPDVRFVFKEWPILDRPDGEPVSEYAARAALAAADQGRYAEVHQALMRAQTLDQAGIDAILQANGVDIARARAFIQAGDTGQYLGDTMRLAQTIGATGTPTFLVNGEVIEMREPADLQAAIDRAQAQAPAPAGAQTAPAGPESAASDDAAAAAQAPP